VKPRSRAGDGFEELPACARVAFSFIPPGWYPGEWFETFTRPVPEGEENMAPVPCPNCGLQAVLRGPR
jgi:hypothetical protein